MADYDRFRSFAERYVIERAHGFRKGFEREDAWEATLDARTVFNNIGRVSKDMDDPYKELAQSAGMVGQAAVNQALNRPRPQQPYVGPVAPTVQVAPVPAAVSDPMALPHAIWTAVAQKLSVTQNRGRQKSWRK